MKSKSLLIAIAAFAVTATGVQAYIGTEQLQKAGFSSSQIEALVQARELKAQGETQKARDKLLKAGLDEKKLKKLKQIFQESHQQLHVAIFTNDYEKFKDITNGSSLGDIITNQSDFTQFRQALELRQLGKHDEAKSLFTELGIEDNNKFTSHNKYHNHCNNSPELTFEQQEALLVAQQSNDKETVREILREAGVID